jgi:hypothetical protein
VLTAETFKTLVFMSAEPSTRESGVRPGLGIGKLSPKPLNCSLQLQTATPNCLAPPSPRLAPHRTANASFAWTHSTGIAADTLAKNEYATQWTAYTWQTSQSGAVPEIQHIADWAAQFKVWYDVMSPEYIANVDSLADAAKTYAYTIADEVALETKTSGAALVEFHHFPRPTPPLRPGTLPWSAATALAGTAWR